jgi:hypothetical protein
MPRLHLLLITLLAALLGCDAYLFYARELPNGARMRVHGEVWPMGGHALPNANVNVQAMQRNAFGHAYKAAGYKWTVALCNADSDGDGFSNGAELGDPDCVWQAGMPDPPEEAMQGGGHPGINERAIPRVKSLMPSNKAVPTILNATTITGDGADVEDVWRQWLAALPTMKPVVEVEPHEEERVLFFVLHMLLPTLGAFATLVRGKLGDTGVTSLWRAVCMWVLLYSGIAIGYHRLFSHNTFTPVRWLKNTSRFRLFCLLFLCLFLCCLFAICYHRCSHTTDYHQKLLL